VRHGRLRPQLAPDLAARMRARMHGDVRVILPQGAQQPGHRGSVYTCRSQRAFREHARQWSLPVSVSVSILVDRLEKRGLVRRNRGEHDHRVVEMELTKRGAALAADAPEAAQGRLLHALEGMPAARVRSIRRAIDRLVQAMEASDVHARFFFAEA
jgi:hypothetical protein